MDGLSVAQRLGGGKFLDDLNFALTTVAEDVVVARTKGSVTVTFAIEQIKDEPAVTILSQIKRGHPVPEAKGSIFYAVGDGKLDRNDPRQMTMHFDVVPSGLEVRTPPDAEAEIRRVAE